MYRGPLASGEVCFEGAGSLKVLFSDFKDVHSSLTIYKNSSLSVPKCRFSNLVLDDKVLYLLAVYIVLCIKLQLLCFECK